MGMGIGVGLVAVGTAFFVPLAKGIGDDVGSWFWPQEPAKRSSATPTTHIASLATA